MEETLLTVARASADAAEETLQGIRALVPRPSIHLIARAQNAAARARHVADTLENEALLDTLWERLRVEWSWADGDGRDRARHSA